MNQYVKGLLILLTAVCMTAAAVLAVSPVIRPPRMVEDKEGFSAERAMEDLEEIASEPRVPGTSGYLEAAEYIYGELEALGLEVEITDYVSVRSRDHMANAGRARSVVARLPGTDSSGAVLLSGHLDTVHTTVGAGDCGSGAVAVLEAARVLSQGKPLKNDIIFIMEDGEETSRSGSQSFVDQHPWADDVRVAFNTEAMGSSGGSLLYVTGPENGWLVREALQAMDTPAAYSFVNDIVWKSGTGGSDLDQFLTAAEVGLGLIFLGNTPAYHTMLDSPERLDPATLDHQGEQLLSLARHFGSLRLDGELREDDRIYFNIFPGLVISYSQTVGYLLVTIALLLCAALIYRGVRAGLIVMKEVFISGVIWPFAVLCALAISGGLWYLIRTVDSDLQVFLIGITYERPWFTAGFALLGGGIAGIVMKLRRSGAASVITALLLWQAALSAVTAVVLPGSAYLFYLPLLGYLALFALCLEGERIPQYLRHLSTAAVGSALILIYLPLIQFLGIFSGRIELITDLPFIGLLPAAAAALPLALAAQFGGPSRRLPLILLSIGLVLVTAASAFGSFSPERPKPNMITFIESADTGEAWWVTGATGAAGSRDSLIDEWTQQFFPEELRREGLYSPWGAFAPDSLPAYTAAAEPQQFDPPEARVVSDVRTPEGFRELTVRISSNRHASTMVVRLKSEADIIGAVLAGFPMEGVAQASPKRALDIGLYGFWTPNEEQDIELQLLTDGNKPITIFMEDHVYELPNIAGMKITPRPDWMMPSPTFITDASLVRKTVDMGRLDVLQ